DSGSVLLIKFDLKGVKMKKLLALVLITLVSPISAFAIDCEVSIGDTSHPIAFKDFSVRQGGMECVDVHGYQTCVKLVEQTFEYTIYKYPFEAVGFGYVPKFRANILDSRIKQFVNLYCAEY